MNDIADPAVLAAYQEEQAPDTQKRGNRVLSGY
jgi:hypothetical protein